MIFTIHHKKHRPSFFQALLQFGLKIGDESQRKVCFYSSCKYDLNGIEDDADVNKLFGFGFYPGHQKHSARFGWFYDNDAERIVLMAYCYVNGKRVSEYICEVQTNRIYYLKIITGANSYSFWVKDEQMDLLAVETIFHDGKRRWFGYNLGLFFGGNNKAPHKMKIKIEYV